MRKRMTLPDGSIAIYSNYDIKTILTLRDRLIEVVMFEYGGRTLDGAAFSRLVQIIGEELPVAHLSRRTLVDSVQDLAGVPLTHERVAAACHRLAGNLPALRRGRPARPWQRQEYPEWVPMQIMDARLERDPYRELGAALRLKAMAGSAAPSYVISHWSKRRCRYHARAFGFKRPRGGLSRPVPPGIVYAAPQQLVGLRFLVLMDPKRSAIAHAPAFELIDIPGNVGLKHWNREIHRSRVRLLPGYECPHAFPAAQLCYKCPFGYVSCPAGTHYHDYVQRHCSGCDRENAWHDPASSGMCVDCTVAHALQANKEV